MSGSLLVRVVFGLLVVATFGAFFVTQRLKRSTPVVERVFFKEFLSPNGDGRKDTAQLRFDLPESDRVTVEIVDDTGEPVRTLAEDVPRGVDRPGIEWTGRTARLVWNGRSDGGGLAPDGVYRMRVTLRREGRAVTAPRELVLDTAPPRAAIVSVTPPTFVPGLRDRRGRVRIRFEGPQDPAPLFRVYRTDAGPPREVARFRGPRFRATAEWDGRVGRRPLPDGVYAFSVTVQDEAGNQGSAPPLLPPTRRSAVERSGASVRYLTASGPLVPVAAGDVARIALGPIPRRLRWRLTRLGGGGTVARGRAAGRSFSLRVPADARTGLHLLRVHGGGRSALVPVPVQGARRGRVLVVLPTITWQGRNPVDDDRDGFPDTLDNSGSVRSSRAFAHGRLPDGLATRAAPLLRFLDRERAAYDLTTDLALARGEGPGLEDRTGVLFPQSERWLTEEANLQLRQFVEDGGRLASFGTDSFRRRVSLAERRLAEPSAPEVRDIFGEQVAPEETLETPLIATLDRVGVFRGTDGFIGLFTQLEESVSRAPGLRLVASAGTPDAQQPAFVAYRLGDGLVIRTGAPGWSRSLLSRPEVGEVTRRIWALLSR